MFLKLANSASKLISVKHLPGRWSHDIRKVADIGCVRSADSAIGEAYVQHWTRRAEYDKTNYAVL